MNKINYRVYDVIKSQVTTEKSNSLQRENKLVFEVIKDANAREIKLAVETLFSVKVSKVNIINTPEKYMRKSRYGKIVQGYKKAIVKLAPGFGIDSVKI
jgi:large subunit ribosomal protein L23